MTWVHRFNLRVAQSAFGKYFRLEGSGHPKERKGSFFFTEIRAGLATFFASMDFQYTYTPTIPWLTFIPSGLYYLRQQRHRLTNGWHLCLPSVID